MKKILICLLVIILGLGGFGFYSITPVSSNSEEKIIKVDLGDTGNDVLKTLKSNHLIHNELIAKIYMKVQGITSFKANSYKLSESMSLDQILRVIQSGDSDYVYNNKLTIIEGSTIPQIVATLVKTFDFDEKDIYNTWSNKEYLSTLINKYWFLTDDILNSDILYPLEGYLAPETYYISDVSPTIEDITEMILDQSDKLFSEYKDAMQNSKQFTIHQFISLASVVERESSTNTDRQKIANVFLKRLKKDMKLQSDITVLYALQRTGVKVSNKDLKVDSKYNTYKYKGVPVGPVSCVSSSSLSAVANGKPGKYLYFYACEDGTVIYSKTYEQHQKAVEENPWS